MPRDIRSALVIAAVIALGGAPGSSAQESATDPHHPNTTVTEPVPSATPREAAGLNQGVQPNQPGIMPQGMMGQGMMGQGMMTGLMQPGSMEAMPMQRMHQFMMKIVFSIADADGDGALSFEEFSAVQRRIFDAADADQGGTVTPEELQGFMGE